MKTLWNAFSVLVLLHVVAGAGYVGWLHIDGRLNKERLSEARDIFSLTIEEEQEQAEQAAALEEEAQQRAMDIAHMETVAAGPATVDDLLADRKQRDEISEAKLDHLQRVVTDLQRRVQLEREALRQQVAALAAERKAFEAYKQKELAKLQDEQFQRAVLTLEQLKPKQGKDVFKQRLASGKDEEVVDYLEHMELRKAAAILREFKEVEEVALATDLLEKLRTRGVELN